MVQVNVGKGIDREIDFDKLPQAARDHIMYIGARNVLMDSHASITADEYPDESERKAAAEAMVDKKLDALMRGEVRVQSTREGDPIRAEAVRMAIAAVNAKIKAAGKKPKDYEPKAIREAALKLVTPELLAKAKARVEETRGVAGDLADLGL
jgi:hypothetical protein